MSATDVIAVIALAGAVISLVLQLVESGRRGKEIGLLQDEAKRRDEELALLRQQVEAQREERRSREQAQLAVFAGVQASGSEWGIEYNVGLQNIGESVASQITVDMVNGDGEKVGTSEPVRTLAPGAKAYAQVMTPPRDRFSGPYEIYFEWDDGRSDRNRAASGVQVGPPAP